MSELDESSNVLSGRKEKLVEDLSVKNIFIICLILGAVGIIAGVMLHSSAISLIVPICIMTFYIYVTFTKDTDLPITVIGDSYYYQGFVFTLVALMASLFSLGVNEQVNMNSMVASFGAALVTTIIGLVSRLYVTSFSVEAKNRREQLESQIEKSLDKFSGQIDILTQQVVTSINKVHGQTESTLHETLENYSEINTQVMSEYSTAMQKNIEKINISIDTVSSKISNIVVEPDLISKPLQNSITEILKPLSEYESKYSEVNTKFIELADKLILQYSNSGSQMQKHVDKLETSLTDSISLNSQKYSSSLSTISESIISSLADIKDFKLDTQGVVESKLKDLSQGISSIVDKLETSVAPLSKTSSSLEDLGLKVNASITLVAEETDKLTNVVNKSINSFAGIENFGSNLNNLQETIDEFNTSMKDVISVNKDASTKISSSASATETATGQLASDISEVYKQLAVQVRALRSA
jgi:phage host-nuclease inhibitor protein Gam